MLMATYQKPHKILKKVILLIITLTFKRCNGGLCHLFIIIACSMVCLSLCLSESWYTGELCQNGWTNRNAIWKADSRGSKEPYIKWGVKIGRNHSQPRAVINRRCGLLPNYFGHLFIFITKIICMDEWFFALHFVFSWRTFHAGTLV